MNLIFGPIVFFQNNILFLQCLNRCRCARCTCLQRTLVDAVVFVFAVRAGLGASGNPVTILSAVATAVLALLLLFSSACRGC